MTNARIMHTMLRVGDLQRSIDFYTRIMGMRLLRSTERPEQKYSLAFIGYGDETDQHVKLQAEELHVHEMARRELVANLGVGDGHGKEEPGDRAQH